ncbi:hypothetical protein L3X38_010788 [Prunus dulcis]|uniref:Uncharacterized protein n=1 Tax=Prunus dulcis TaxID=3755 RepID=A0AAD4WIF1_PRUDU|nr:hypothetical protein L3X38_010788 [Prunus dulcis]
MLCSCNSDHKHHLTNGKSQSDLSGTDQTCSYVALLKSSSFGTENKPSNDQRLCKEFVDLGQVEREASSDTQQPFSVS